MWRRQSTDHSTTVGTIDLKKHIEKLNFKFGKDYAAVYDSTMARFWFFNEKAKNDITTILENTAHGKILDESEKERYRINFKDHMFGECIFLMEPGYQIEPSDMGVKALPAMHGFAPEDKDSDASFLANFEPKKSPSWVGDFHQIMIDKMDEN